MICNLNSNIMRILCFRNTHPGIKDFKKLLGVIRDLYIHASGLRFELVETKRIYSIKIYWVKSDLTPKSFSYLQKKFNQIFSS